MAPTAKTTKVSQLRRNERERKRVNQVNDGFDRLRDCVTKASSNKKLSKAETLREAVKYIQHLKKILEDESAVFQVKEESSGFHSDYFMGSVSSSTYPSPPSFYDETSFYQQAPMQLTPPQGGASSNDFFPHHYGIPQYQQVMRSTP